MQVGEAVESFAEYLKQYKAPWPRKTVEYLMAYALKIHRRDLCQNYHKILEEDIYKSVKKNIRKRALGTPLEYLLGFVDFYHCKIHITPSVLIPRPETEILIDEFVNRVSKRNLENQVLFDVCTGSGCMGIAVKKALPMLDVYLSDISPSALKIARRNAEENEVEIQLLKGSLFAPYKDKKADFILCNPPYLSEDELKVYKNYFEPKCALLGGETGYEFYEKISKKILDYVRPKATVFMEIGYNQGEEVMRIFKKIPCRSIEVRKDWAGLDRFFFLEIE